MVTLKSNKQSQKQALSHSFVEISEWAQMFRSDGKIILAKQNRCCVAAHDVVTTEIFL